MKYLILLKFFLQMSIWSQNPSHTKLVESDKMFPKPEMTGELIKINRNKTFLKPHNLKKHIH